MNHVFIVAEIGCNHNGNKKLAREMVLAAKRCGADAVKFQAFKAIDLISRYAPKAEYQKAVTKRLETQLEMTAKLELPYSDLAELMEFARSLGMVAFSTPFDMGSIEYLDSIGQKIWKIPSGEITNLPYLQKIGSINREGKKIILSSGMATTEEIRICINQLVEAGTSEKDIVLLHCNTEYPTPDKDINLFAILDLKEKFRGMPIGFSDHSTGYVAAVGAVVLGVCLIEKHFTLDKNMEGPDHKASATPEELKALCENVRRMEWMVGQKEKIVTDSERKNKKVARKSIVALKDIKAGEVFTESNIVCKRPGNGISPMEWYNVLGKTAEKNFYVDELISVTGIGWQNE